MLHEKTVKSYFFGPFRLDISHGTLSLDGKLLAVSPMRFETLVILVKNAGRTVGKEELIGLLWPETFVQENSLSQNIFHLRKLLRKGHGTEDYIETVPKRGYRFIAEVFPDIEKNGTSDEIQPSGQGIRSLAVLPFSILGNSEEGDQALGMGIMESIIARLGSTSQLAIMPARTVLKYTGRDDNLRRVARQQGIEATIEGTIQRCGDRVRLTANLVSLGSGLTLWTGKFDERLEDIFAIEDGISDKLASVVLPSLTTDHSYLAYHSSTQNIESHQAFLMGTYLSNKRTKQALSRSIHHFEQSISNDPHNAKAYAGLADAFFWLAHDSRDEYFRNVSFEKSRANASKAIAIDPRISLGHAALATIKIKQDHDPVGAEKSFTTAITVNPNCSITRSRYTYFLAAMGRLDEALTTIQRAQQLDPLSPDINASLALVQYFLCEYDNAIRSCDNALELEDDLLEASLIKGRCYLQQERLTDAENLFLGIVRAETNGTEANEMLGYLYAITGRERLVRQMLRDFEKPSAKAALRPYNIAAIYNALNDTRRAEIWLTTPFVNWTEQLRMLRYDPRLQNLKPTWQKKSQTFFNKM